MTVAIANEEAAAAWEHEAEGWIANAERYEKVGVRYDEQLSASLSIANDAQTLDIGCGSGSLTIELASRAKLGHAVGLDISSRMVEHARSQAQAAGVDNVTFVSGDAQVHPFAAGEFDGAVSAFGGMFFNDPTAAFANIRHALRPGASLTMLAWRRLSENEWLTAIRGSLASGRALPEPPNDAPGPFGLADPDHVRSVLDAAGYSGVELTPLDEMMWFGTDTDDAFEFLRTFGITRGLTEDLSADDREQALAALRQTVADHETTDGVFFGSAAWLITAVA
jgi:SAM-dependent methyltransferase